VEDFRNLVFGAPKPFYQPNHDQHVVQFKRRKVIQNPELDANNQLTHEQMEREKQFLKSQYDFAPLCNEFEIVYEDSAKFNK